MVYESDFYTTRRPYTRPYVSSYNVTPLSEYLAGPFYMPITTRIYYVRGVPHMPYVAHRKLVSIVHTVPTRPIRIYHSGTYLPIKIHTRIRPSVIAAELNRIRYLLRPSTQCYTERYLQSKDFIDFDDEAKDIRARSDALLRRIHVFVPRPSPSDYSGEIQAERLRSDDYIRRIINTKNQRKDLDDLPWYTTPEKRDIHDGHLSCVKYVGGRPQSKRRPYYTVNDLRPTDVKSDVHLLSFYLKNRKAAEDALKKQPDEETIKRVEEYLKKKAEEARIEEERKLWEIAERKRKAQEAEAERLALLQIEEEKRRVEIQAMEKAEAERRIVERRAQLAREEEERLKADEKLLTEAVSQAIADEEEREVQEKVEQARRKQQDEEEVKLNPTVASLAPVDESVTEQEHVETEHSEHELSDQEKEELPYELDADDKTQVEEEEETNLENDEIENPFLDDDAANSVQKETEPLSNEPEVKESETGGEQAYEETEIKNQQDIEIEESSGNAIDIWDEILNERKQPASNFEAESAEDADEAIADEVHFDQAHDEESAHDASDVEQDEIKQIEKDEEEFLDIAKEEEKDDEEDEEEEDDEE